VLGREQREKRENRFYWSAGVSSRTEGGFERKGEGGDSKLPLPSDFRLEGTRKGKGEKKKTKGGKRKGFKVSSRHAGREKDWGEGGEQMPTCLSFSFGFSR